MTTSTLATLTANASSPMAASLGAVQAALDAVGKVAKFRADIKVTKYFSEDDCGEIEIIFPCADSRNGTYVATAMAMLADNENLSDRVRDTWLSYCDREEGDTRFNVQTYWVQA